MAKRKTSTQRSDSKVNLSAPWAINDDDRRRSQSIDTTSEETAAKFIKARTELHQVYIQEQEKTKRLWLILAVVSVLVALALIVFAPEGRETLSYWIGGALLIFAAGAAGYKRVWGKSKIFSVGADQDNNNLNKEDG